MKPYWQRDPKRYSKCAIGHCQRTALADYDECELHLRIARMEHYGKDVSGLDTKFTRIRYVKQDR